MSKCATLLLLIVLTLSSLIMVESTSALSKTMPLTAMSVLPTPPQIPANTQNLTYILPNYVVYYTIVGMPPPDSLSVNPYAYNIVVYGPPPFPIQIDFYQLNTQNVSEKMSVVMPTNAYSTSIGCNSYPTQITMMQADQASTSVMGIINSDTIWTKANSPYTLTGAVGVISGVTLTIEAGVTVNLGSNYMQVNGTLRAIGSATDPIRFNEGGSPAIRFTDSSSDWNEAAASGCIIENAVINHSDIQINNASPKISNSTFNCRISTSGGSPLILNSIFKGETA